MSYCCSYRPKTTFCHNRNIDYNECSCCLSDELNLVKLKNTNYELKSLINRLDELSSSVEHNYHAHKCTRFNYDECNLCRSCKNKNNTNHYHYNLTVCDDCERMVRLSSELERMKVIQVDSNIYPLEKYHSGKRYYCDKCDKCDDDLRRRRSRSRSRNASPFRESRVVTPEPRPLWNAGPWVSYYPMTKLKLSEMNK
ncbi:unnamed protein product [Brachionus calyciflorus]|uniref:Uncharacterized protein n=1 Tax=Brachionus calyciflorus TaxID=104777 RepID=A0A813RSW0_9BILA|nr:unnamed protein product [Brachionus calyciflorus]